MSTRTTETDDGYTLLRRAILEGELLPNERLVEHDLVQRFEIGRAAIRTALARLEQDGIVEREPFRGARVRLISIAEAIEILEARSVLEGLAVRSAALKATAKDVKALRAILKRMQERFKAGDLLGGSEVNTELHKTLLEIAKHSTATRLIEGLQAQNVRHQFRTILVPGRATHSLEEHRAIVEAVAAHDADAAEHSMRLHLSHVLEALRQTANPLAKHSTQIKRSGR
jgi:DNA-binding GntR family transcriptional regulator